ncbi:unnamed protein product [Rotaria magnacalcarata]|uniref:Uncharacterized protein n=6 Tax=Rotaria magnacalcarata TaxID=392030 RepID=A0A819IV65_9BILA|nr:unnamed protein product [Rotaria magnacalcarata]CAF2014536.1 unnamed protein product [Rotaria magnacalcarata]CAF2031941.1 unnamed protein product [Rotaria magnacalcarata]CAF2212038.1 unnamed protein product [Rotaria magnacalcarata]CAF3920305.1 unnamed protein product [Rotaria magnacalcarata]
MSYRYVYPNGGVANVGYGADPTLMSPGYPNMYNNVRRSYSPESFSSDSESSDDYEYRGRMVSRETRHPQDIVRTRTPPPIIKRVVERAPTPEPTIMERVIIRPQAQEIVERVIEQPRTPPPRIVQKEMQEEAPPPIVRTRVIKVDRPMRNGYSQPGSPYNHQYNGLTSVSNGFPGNGYRAQSVAGSVGRPAVYHNTVGNNKSFSSSSSFEYMSAEPMPSAVPSSTMMFMPALQQTQPLGVMQHPQQQMMYRPFQMQSSIPPLPSTYMPQNYRYPPAPHPGMSFSYRPMMQQGRMLPTRMPMMATANTFCMPTSNYSNQPNFFNPKIQQLVY